MKWLKFKKTKEKKIIWTKFRGYIDFVILACCFVIALNIHPNTTNNENNPSEMHIMTYIFHDYEWNEYVMNDHAHGVSNTRDYLFEDEVPEDLKWEEMEEEMEFKDSISLGDLINNQQSDFDNTSTDNVKDNQISFEDIISDLWEDYQNTNLSESNTDDETNSLVINVLDNEFTNNENNYYTITEDNSSWDSSLLIIEKIDNNDNNVINEKWEEKNNKTVESNDNKNDNLLSAKVFTFIEEGWVFPTLVPRNDLFFNENDEAVGYTNNSNDSSNKEPWIKIIEDYADCMTPWWYKIVHWDSVLAYKQMADAPDICHIERRFCWKWKLSGTYTQQWCSVNKNYTYEERGTLKATTTSSDNNFKWGTRQNSNWTVTVKKTEILWSSVLDKPNKIYSDFNESDNIRIESPWVEQTSRSYPDCTAPRWEKVKHWQFIQAFKHENWFSDSPCEAQIRLCSMWKLMWTYTESTCKTRDTSFIDWVNGSPSRKTYSEEKLELVKKQMAAEERYYEDTRQNGKKSINSETLDRILYILDQD